MQGTTKSGFNYSVDDRVLKDWRFTIALSKCRKGDAMTQLEGMHEMVHLVFGDKYDEFMEHMASKCEGYIPTDAVMAEVNEIFESAVPKN
jgi:hypothetical protein